MAKMTAVGRRLGGCLGGLAFALAVIGAAAPQLAKAQNSTAAANPTAAASAPTGPANAASTPSAAASAPPAAAPPPASPFNSGDTAWMLTSMALVLMMTIPGLALFYGGMVRKKNVIATTAQSFAMTA